MDTASKTLQPVTDNVQTMQRNEFLRNQREENEMSEMYNAGLYDDNAYADELAAQDAMNGLNDEYASDGMTDMIAENMPVNEEAEQSQKLNHVFASVFRKIADVFGKDNAIGAKCDEWADAMEATSASDAESKEIQEAVTDGTYYGENENNILDDEMSSPTQEHGGSSGVMPGPKDGKKISFEEATRMDTNSTKKDGKSDMSETARDGMHHIGGFRGAGVRKDGKFDINDMKEASKNAEKTSTSNMHKAGINGVTDDMLIEIADYENYKFRNLDSKMSDMTSDLGTQAALIMAPGTSNEKPNAEFVSSQYMSMMRGLDEYGKSATDSINEMYGDDEASRTKAMEGLNKMLDHTATPALKSLAQDNDIHGFLSENDKKELDSMTFGDSGYEFSYQSAVDGVQQSKTDKQANLDRLNGYEPMITSGQKDSGKVYESKEDKAFTSNEPQMTKDNPFVKGSDQIQSRLDNNKSKDMNDKSSKDDRLTDLTERLSANSKPEKSIGLDFE